MGYKERVLEFHKIYSSKLVPIFEAYEIERRQMLLQCAFYLFVALLIVSFLFYELHMISESEDTMLSLTLILIAFLSIGIVLWLLCENLAKKFAMRIKSGCLPYILKVFGDVEWKNGVGVISDDKLNDSGLFGFFNRRQIDDEFEGTYNGVLFKVCETSMQYESGSGKRRSCTPIFKGVVISFKTNKKIKNRTIVATKGDITRKNAYMILFPLLLLNATISILQGDNPWVIAVTAVALGLIYFSLFSNKGEALDEVKLEDVAFCRNFRAYSSDQVEARYLLTTAFINRFQNLNTSFCSKRAKCSFFNDEIMFAIDTNKNLFEVGSLFKTLQKPDSINVFYNELSSIYKMVEYFKLDQKIGL